MLVRQSRMKKKKPSQIALLVIFLIFFLQRIENVHEAKDLLPLSAAGSCISFPSKRVYGSPRLLEGGVTSNQIES